QFTLLFPYGGSSAPYIASGFPEVVIPPVVDTCTLRMRGRQREPRRLMDLMNAAHYPGVEPCSMAGRQTGIGIKRDHLLPARSSDHRMRCAQSHRVLTTREETMTGT